MAMAMAKLLLPFLLLLLLLLHPVQSSSFSFPSFDNTSSLFSSLLLHGVARFAPTSSSIDLSGHSPNSSGSLFFSHPIAMSASLSFSSSFSFSLDLLHRDTRDTLSFVVVAPVSAKSLPSSETLASVRLDSLLGQESDAYSSDLREVLARGGMLKAFVEYDSARKEVDVRLNKPGMSPPLRSYHLDLAKYPLVYVGFMATTGDKHMEKKKKEIYSWSFDTWDVSQHSMPLDPSLMPQQRQSYNLILENPFLRLMSLLFAAALCASVSVVAVWVVLERAFGRARRELAMLPVLCDYEQVLKNQKEEEKYCCELEEEEEEKSWIMAK